LLEKPSCCLNICCPSKVSLEVLSIT
jgi:hypothetical protein